MGPNGDEHGVDMGTDMNAGADVDVNASASADAPVNVIGTADAGAVMGPGADDMYGEAWRIDDYPWSRADDVVRAARVLMAREVAWDVARTCGQSAADAMDPAPVPASAQAHAHETVHAPGASPATEMGRMRLLSEISRSGSAGMELRTLVDIACVRPDGPPDYYFGRAPGYLIGRAYMDEDGRDLPGPCVVVNEVRILDAAAIPGTHETDDDARAHALTRAHGIATVVTSDGFTGDDAANRGCGGEHGRRRRRGHGSPRRPWTTPLLALDPDGSLRHPDIHGSVDADIAYPREWIAALMADTDGMLGWIDQWPHGLIGGDMITRFHMAMWTLMDADPHAPDRSREPDDAGDHDADDIADDYEFDYDYEDDYESLATGRL